MVYSYTVYTVCWCQERVLVHIYRIILALKDGDSNETNVERIIMALKEWFCYLKNGYGNERMVLLLTNVSGERTMVLLEELRNVSGISGIQLKWKSFSC
jgi:hypothetical protein